MACNTFSLREDVNLFVEDIIENPYKINDLGYNYPNFYNDSLSVLLLKDSIVKAKLIKFIKDTFSLNRSYSLYKIPIEVKDLFKYRNYKEYKTKFSHVIGIYSFLIVNGNNDYLEFNFAVFNQNNIAIFDIWFNTNFAFYP